MKYPTLQYLMKSIDMQLYFAKLIMCYTKKMPATETAGLHLKKNIYKFILMKNYATEILY